MLCLTAACSLQLRKQPVAEAAAGEGGGCQGWVCGGWTTLRTLHEYSHASQVRGKEKGHALHVSRLPRASHVSTLALDVELLLQITDTRRSGVLHLQREAAVVLGLGGEPARDLVRKGSAAAYAPLLAQHAHSSHALAYFHYGVCPSVSEPLANVTVVPPWHPAASIGSTSFTGAGCIQANNAHCQRGSSQRRKSLII